MNFCVRERPLISKEHSVNPIGSILIPVTVMTKGHLSFVNFSFKDSNVLRLMQLFIAPVSYKALILRPKLFIGKTVPMGSDTYRHQIGSKSVLVVN